MGALPDGNPPPTSRRSPKLALDRPPEHHARAALGATTARIARHLVEVKQRATRPLPLRATRGDTREDALPPRTERSPRQSQQSPQRPQRFPAVVLQADWWREREWSLPLLIVLAILLWVILGPRLIMPHPTGRVIATVTGMIVLTIIGMRWLRQRFGLNSEGAMSLPNPLYALYLVAVILLGGHAGVAIALVAPVLYSLPDIVRRTASWETLLRQSCVSALGTLFCSLIFGASATTMALSLGSLQAHVVAAVVAAAVMLVAAAVVALWPYGAPWRMRGWRTDLGSPSFRFQALMLMVCPLFPLAEMLRGAEAELAWVLLIIPLYVIYYLSLISMRLEQRTAELQRTVLQLRAVRRREAELTNYAALITHAQEEERRRLARELHDDTAQALIALSRGIDTLSAHAAQGTGGLGDDHPFIEDLSDLAKRTLDGIRRACQDLRPSVLDDLGLAPALDSLAKSLTERGLPCECARIGTPRPCRPEVEVTIYRIAQEALSNALHHAEASHAWITLTYAHEYLILAVRDDGHGFDSTNLHLRQAGRVDRTTGHTGLGLLGMRERAALLGAELDINSVPGQGTEITVQAPLATEDASGASPDTTLDLPLDPATADAVHLSPRASIAP